MTGTTEKPGEEGFLQRWSRRKVEERDAAPEAAEDVLPAADVVEEPLGEEAALAKFREEDPELAETIAKVDIDAMTYEDDFSVFMNEKVPEFLRRKALSKLWLSNPVLANVDGLVDYGEDFTDAATVIENFQSAYQPGKGYATAEEDEELVSIEDESADSSEVTAEPADEAQAKEIDSAEDEDHVAELDEDGEGVQQPEAEDTEPEDRPEPSGQKPG